MTLLSEAEVTTLHALSLGFTVQEVADLQGVTRRIVQRRMIRVRHKAARTTDCGAVAWAYDQGLLPLPGAVNLRQSPNARPDLRATGTEAAWFDTDTRDEGEDGR